MAYLSIIVPVYNKEAYIEACIDAILNQTFTDFELILVDDGSTDNSASICKRYAGLDNRIRLIHQPNSGVSSARNTGLQIATGVYTGFVDSDDTIERDMYELLLKNARTFDADISACHICTVFPYKSIRPIEISGAVNYDRQESLLKFFQGYFDMNLNNKIYRSDIARQIQFTGRIYEDIMYMCRAFLKGRNVVMERVVKYNYIVRGSSAAMGKFNGQYLETVAVSAKMLDLIAGERPDIIAAAEVFDITANISLLNLLLMNGKSPYKEAYHAVVKKLKHYEPLIKSGLVRKKHRYAFRLFSLSPALYTGLMYMYCRITKSEVLERTQ